MAKNLKSVMCIFGDTALAYSETNIVLPKDTIVYETDTLRIKIGDGITPWNDLEYVVKHPLLDEEYAYITNVGQGNGFILLEEADGKYIKSWETINIDGPSTRSGYILETIGDVTYIHGGIRDGIYLSDTWAYDHITNTWTELLSGPMVANHKSCIVDTAIYFVGGSTIDGYTNKTYKYETTDNTWTELSPYIDPIAKHSVCSDGTYMYLTGGETSLNMGDAENSSANVIDGGQADSSYELEPLDGGSSNDGVFALNSFYRYDPSLDTWTPLTNMPGGVSDHVSIFREGRVHVLFGNNDSGDFLGAYKYNFVSGIWMVDLSYNTSVKNPYICQNYYGFHILGGKVDNVDEFDSVYSLFTDTGTFKLNKDLPTEVTYMDTALTIYDRNIYVINNNLTSGKIEVIKGILSQPEVNRSYFPDSIFNKIKTITDESELATLSEEDRSKVVILTGTTYGDNNTIGEKTFVYEETSGTWLKIAEGRGISEILEQLFDIHKDTLDIIADGVDHKKMTSAERLVIAGMLINSDILITKTPNIEDI